MGVNEENGIRTECHKRSIVRSVIWRLIGIAFLAGVTYFYTGSPVQTTMITLLHHGIFIVVYYLHERAWMNRLESWRYKKYARVFTYEIILGNGILGTISLLITGSWALVTHITLTYILNKLWMYYLYDRAWDRTDWGCTYMTEGEKGGKD